MPTEKQACQGIADYTHLSVYRALAVVSAKPPQDPFLPLLLWPSSFQHSNRTAFASDVASYLICSIRNEPRGLPPTSRIRCYDLVRRIEILDQVKENALGHADRQHLCRVAWKFHSRKQPEGGKYWRNGSMSTYVHRDHARS